MRGKLLWFGTQNPSTRITPADAGKTQTAIPVHHIRGDHPRRCGENRVGVGGADGNSGSPPQVRGKLRASTGRTGSSRITPAGAGKTLRASPYSTGSRDHPRRCGENIRAGGKAQCPAGSPPQVRGKLDWILPQSALFGITPAGAGKTLSHFQPRL